jgi:membrane protein YqaA with SNARE-associated domain
MSDADRDAGNRKVKLGFLLLVAVSPPLIAFQWEATPAELLAAFGVGLVLGALLVWYLGRLAAEFTNSGPRARRRR